MPIVRKKLIPADVYPEDIRYNQDTDQVQRLVNGAWVDAPESDPRTHTTFPPRLTSDPACDAAQSASDALKSKIAPILEAIDNSATVFSIAGLILSIFTFGVFAIFVGLALGIGNIMLDAGTTAISAALTDTAFHKLACILRCHMDTSGRLTEGSLGAVEADVSDQIGGLGAILLNAMLSLAGEGGINNLAAIGTSTGDCGDCDCDICDMDLWSHVGLGTELERGDNYVIIEAVNVAGAFGDWRVVIDTTDPDVCCPVNGWSYVTPEPTFPVKKWIPCGTPYVGEESFNHGQPGVGVQTWAIGIDAISPFTVRFNFL